MITPLDVFVVKYDQAGQRELAVHRDNGLLTFACLLSEPDAFEAGGTYFESLGESGQTSGTDSGKTLRPDRGQMLSHWGVLRPAGQPVTKGVRYILAGFVRAEPLAAALAEERRFESATRAQARK